MIEKINKLEAAFKESLKAALDHIDSEKTDSILDNRYLPVFLDAWMEAYHAIDEKAVDQETEDRITNIRKEIFVSIFRITNFTELPAYISDDFALISSYYMQNIENKWVANLLFTYLNHQIPQGELMQTDKTIEELLQ
ncbi:hypothetical protein EG347_09425 [Chryseobacterium sp. G0186]|uniref:hypothetical protein n=1 Tax=Chryseobacterium sp. G0186 TaxID=2487064 RepID=UPI000F4DF2D2|nr:hypothetical protein [Chryseobacterium sp. G0186]AZA77725.1 hypothetical protein EG347_09425 [Chryseobacterium sp. G0186]